MTGPPSPVCLPVFGNLGCSPVVVCSILMWGLEVPYLGHLGDRCTGEWMVVFHRMLHCDDKEVYSSLWTLYEKSPVQMLLGSDLLWWILVSIDPELRVSSCAAVISGSVLVSCSLFQPLLQIWLLERSVFLIYFLSNEIIQIKDLKVISWPLCSDDNRPTFQNAFKTEQFEPKPN